MKTALFAAAAAVAAALPIEQVFAWEHSGSWTGAGGRTATTSASGSWGHGWSGSASGSEGRTATASGNAYGWHGSGSNGGQAAGNYHGWAAVGPNDHYATGTRYGVTGTGAYGYHPPAVVNHYYGGSGCYHCGGWGTAAAGAAVGVAAGAAVGAAAASAYRPPPPVYAAPAYYPGTVYPVLPPGCGYRPYAGMAYYNCNGAWFRPAYGANGAYYTVVPAP